MRHPRNTEKTLDAIAKIVCVEKQKEIEELREYIEEISKKARGYAWKYSGMSGQKDAVADFPHDLEDFLQSI